MDYIDNDNLPDLPDIISASVEKLKVFVNPFGCWFDLKSEITMDEIKNAISKFDKSLNYEDLSSTDYDDESFRQKSTEEKRDSHIQKIVFFVLNDVNLPIDVDVGIEGHYFVDYIVTDGNHRLAAAMFKNQEFIDVAWSGGQETMRNLELDKHPTPTEKKIKPQ